MAASKGLSSSLPRKILASSSTYYVLLGLVITFMIFYWWLSRTRGLGIPMETIQGRRTPPKALLIVAHPDDECLFFSPTILGLKAQGYKTLLLCLSTGNFYGKGHIREKELYKSCAVLGIEQGSCSIMNHSSLQDNPKDEWDAVLLSQVIHRHINSTQPDVIVTFDEGGVSGHLNHRSILPAVNRLIYAADKNMRLPKNVSVYALETTNILREFTGLLDILLSWWWGKTLYVAGYSGVITGWKAMWGHWSQLEFIRVLYLGFSRYMYMNTLREIRQEDL